MTSCLSFIFKSRSRPDTMETKAFKVKLLTNDRQVGVAVKSLSELEKKVKDKFNNEIDGDTRITFVLSSDGTIIDDDDYMQSLPNQEVLIALRPTETYHDRCDWMLSKLPASSEWSQITDKIKTYLQTEELSMEQANLLSNLASNLRMNERIRLEMREEDPKWFEGVPSRFKTKNNYMKERAKSRIRGYYDHAKKFLMANQARGMSQTEQSCVDEILLKFNKRLKEEDYKANFFARSPSNNEFSFCDREGWFQCLGLYNLDSCNDNHSFNPYGSKDARVLFSIWELDHKIEKTREVLPTLKETIKNSMLLENDDAEVNWNYFYDLLFTESNLKLVHPLCHDKTLHRELKCDPTMLFIEA